MRAGKFVVAAALSAVLVWSGVPQAPEGAEAAVTVTCAPPGCRQFTIFGNRFTPRIYRFPAPKSLDDLARNPYQVFWVNGDRNRVDRSGNIDPIYHNVRSTTVRDGDGNLLSFRNSDGDVVEGSPGLPAISFDVGDLIGRTRPPPRSVVETKGGTASVTFDAPGTYNYQCRFHPNMAGTIIVPRPPTPRR